MHSIALMAFSSPVLDLDITLFMQFGIFILVMLMLRKYVVLPYLEALDARLELTEGAQAEARAAQTEAAVLQAEYESARQRAFQEAERQRKELVLEAQEAASVRVESARLEASTALRQRQSSLELELKAARQRAQTDCQSLAQSIVQKLLSEKKR